MITVTSKQLRAFLAITPRDDVRYYLHGIYLDTAQRVLVATNGHMMAVWRPEGSDTAMEFDGNVNSPIIPRDTLDQALKIAGPTGQIHISTSFVIAAPKKGDTVTLHFTPIDARYPDWQKVVPGLDGTRGDFDYAPQFNAEYLATIQTFLCSLSGDKNPHQHIQSFGGNYAAIITRSDVDNAFCVCMPLRTEVNSDAVINLMAKVKLSIAS